MSCELIYNAFILPIFSIDEIADLCIFQTIKSLDKMI